MVLAQSPPPVEGVLTGRTRHRSLTFRSRQYLSRPRPEVSSGDPAAATDASYLDKNRLSIVLPGGGGVSPEPVLRNPHLEQKGHVASVDNPDERTLPCP